MDQLNGIDRGYLGLETDDVAADFLNIIVLDPSTAPDRHDFERFRAEAAARVPKVATLTRRLVSAPMGVAPEQWVVDPDFDIDRHLVRVACPSPGDLPTLQQLALDLCSGTLDRDRPLWAMWYVEGLADGGAALLFKMHHAAVDGMGAVEAFQTLFDTEPLPFDPDLAPTPVEGQRVPSGIEMMVRTLPGQALVPWRVARGTLEVAGAQLRALGEGVLGLVTGSSDDSSSEPAGRAPATLFNRQPESTARSLALTTVPVDDVKTVAHDRGATVNDVVLAMVTGALRTYLQDRGELPDVPLRAACPVNVRTEDDTEGGNAFTAMLVPLPTHLDDPAERLRYLVAATEARKPSGESRNTSARSFLDLVDTVPSAVFSVMGFLASSGALTSMPPLANLIVSNVKGSPVPLYLAGARITHIHGRTMAGPGLGMMIHCGGYADQLDFGITALRDLVPDPEVLMAGIVAELGRLSAT